METQRQAEGVAEQVGPDPGGEPLAHHLHVEALGALQGQPQQHRHQQQPNQQPQRYGHRQGGQHGQAGLMAQHRDRLAHQQGLDRPGQGQGDEHQQRQQQAPPIAAEIGEKPPQPLDVEGGHQAGTGWLETERMRSTIA